MYAVSVMFTKPTRRVRITARNVHDGKSKTFTLYDTDCDEVINTLESSFASEQAPAKRTPRKSVKRSTVSA